ncbi:MAG: sugar phosphate isomerase/epimerase [Acetobacteraceae bacterium]|nr:sugar phosphate isomerase/epimerase [Acetobacteraceae bacterium]
MRPISLAHLTVMDADPIALIDAGAAGGFDAVGLRIVAPMPSDRIVHVINDPPLQRRIRERLDATGLTILDIEAVWLTASTNVEDLVPALEVGARLGAKFLLVVGNDPDSGRTKANFAAICERARAVGLGVVLEPMSYVHLSTIAKATDVLNAVGQPNAKLLIDALHFHRAGGQARDIAQLDPGLLPYMHLCDAPTAKPEPDRLRVEGRSERFYPGQGELPLEDFVQAFPGDTPAAVEAPCAQYATLPVIERGRLCGEATRSFLRALKRGRQA